ncbi:MAG: YkgJ family cysteine cluster protein [Deltaproteobacteria bacterium]|jgi:Fe-S-cluster containining protein|nr:YkgJ family cysteine cluster protein [Deltaproteobacteria bacterium]
MTLDPSPDLCPSARPQPAFDCQRCGQCCQGRGGTWLNFPQVKVLADFLALEPDQLIKTYLEKDKPARPIQEKGPIDQASREQTSREQALWTIGLGPEGFCLFFDLKEKSCLIHPVKPLSCQSWPFYHWLVTSQAGFLEAQSHCPGLEKLDYQTFSRAFEATGLKRPPRSLKKLVRPEKEIY